MSQDEMVKAQSGTDPQQLGSAPVSPLDPKQKALALGLEFSRRALEAQSLDELFFILTNDIRVLVEFDRALLITHLGGQSQFVAAANQPILSKKSAVYKSVSGLGEHLKEVRKGIWLAREAETVTLSEQDLPPEAREQLLAYMGLSGCAFLLCVPLIHNKWLVGHILMEFEEKSAPSEVQVLTLLGVAPFFGAALAEKWLFQQNPALQTLVAPGEESASRSARFGRIAVVAAAVLCAAVLLLFAVPVVHTVGGESELIPRDKHMAFVKTEGLIDKINVKEGSPVEKDQIIAVLDGRELDHEIRTAERRFDLLTKEAMLLRRESGQEPAKLAESQLVELKRKSAWDELKYLQWKAQFLEIRAPVSGIVSTKEVDSLVGKKFRAGEPFCEIAIPGELWVEIYVPEDRISLVRPGQTALIYLNTEPGKGHRVTVAEVAPIAEVLPRLGNVYRAKGPFTGGSDHVKVGMKGIGKIETERTNLFHIIAQRVAVRWNRFSIYF
jgi:multidrug resistance efflux pump